MVKTGIRKTSRPIFKLCQTFLFSNFKNKEIIYFTAGILICCVKSGLRTSGPTNLSLFCWCSEL